jgi:arylsulfatase A-like enzyme
LMLGDNLGYGVPSCYNGGILDIPAPRINKLAGQGLRLMNFNVENQCSPSRAALMTGRLKPATAQRLSLQDTRR